MRQLCIQLTVPQLTALCGRYGLDRNCVKADVVSRLCIALCKDEPVTAAKLASEDAREAKTLAEEGRAVWAEGASAQGTV
jgi:hypothetical protein